MASLHFGPWPFGSAENPTGKQDFAVGERVLVELDGPKDAYVVRSVIPACQPQPEGTECGDGLVEEMDLDNSLLRLASEQECAERRLSVPAGTTAYCIVTNHGNGADGPRVFIIADGVDVEFRPCTASR